MAVPYFLFRPSKATTINVTFTKHLTSRNHISSWSFQDPPVNDWVFQPSIMFQNEGAYIKFHEAWTKGFESSDSAVYIRYSQVDITHRVSTNDDGDIQDQCYQLVLAFKDGENMRDITGRRSSLPEGHPKLKMQLGRKKSREVRYIVISFTNPSSLELRHIYEISGVTMVVPETFAIENVSSEGKEKTSMSNTNDVIKSESNSPVNSQPQSSKTSDKSKTDTISEHTNDQIQLLSAAKRVSLSQPVPADLDTPFSTKSEFYHKFSAALLAEVEASHELDKAIDRMTESEKAIWKNFEDALFGFEHDKQPPNRWVLLNAVADIVSGSDFQLLHCFQKYRNSRQEATKQIETHWLETEEALTK